MSCVQSVAVFEVLFAVVCVPRSRGKSSQLLRSRENPDGVIPNSNSKADSRMILMTVTEKRFSEHFFNDFQGPLNGGVSNGGVSRSGLVLPFLSFFVLFGTFPIFPGFSRFARGWSGDFPDSSLFRFSAY